MYSKTEVLFCAVALAILLTVQARILKPSDAMERAGKCVKSLGETCPGAADTIPFAYAPNPQKIDESCTAAEAHFPCFKTYVASCDPEDIESLYFLTYIEICDKASPLYEGIRKSIKCMKEAEINYNKTCTKPMYKLEAELKAFESKKGDISNDDWIKLQDGLTTRQEMDCYLQRTKECDEGAVDTVEVLYLRLGSGKQIDFLVKNHVMVNTVLENLNLDEEQKKMLRG